MQSHALSQPEQTEELGARLAAAASPGDVFLLYGSLGAGKTTMVRGIARGLQLDAGEVHSPTFVIQHIHEGPCPLYHFDLYRLRGSEELFDFGAEDYFWGQGLSVIEWPQIAEGLLPPNRLDIHLELHPTDPEQRLVRLVGHGSWALQKLESFLE
jgi:tRNA threonylcarbamoyladenosine biosynthesis protein TsaE